MPVVQDHAVVLRLSDYSETSQIVTVFTADHGLQRLIAKGSRRSTKQRFAAGLDLLEYGELGFSPVHGDARLGTLTEWAQREAFTGLRREAIRLYGGLYAAELLVELTEEADPHPGLFAALLRMLRALAGNEPAVEQVPRFQSALLREIGYAPNLKRCSTCEKPVGRGLVFFSASAGGVVCRDCEHHHVEKWRVSPRIYDAQLNAKNAPAWFELLDYHLTHLAGKRLKTAVHVARAIAGSPRA